ncbi:hypothetical protein B0A53_00943 [Rhodotorula sp. CCFEE 5036]|nr:hypothetical protein B0A53_00943 [Rhodotorula sp. CCFEE 5036]
MLRSTRAAARAVQAAARTPAPSPAHLAPRQPALAPSHLRLLSSTAIARSDSNAAASNVSESVAAQSSSAAAAAPTPEPEQSPAPIDQQHATELPTEEIPAVSSSLDATAPSNNTQATTTSEPEQSPAPIDQQHATELPTEEIPAVSSSLDATAPKPAEAAQPTPEQVAEKVSRTVFVAGLNWSVTDEVLIEEIHKHLEAEEGVSQVRIATDPAGRSKGFAFVELTSTDLVQQLLSKPTLVIADREAIFKASKTPIGQTPPRSADAASKKYPTKRGPNARYPPGPTIYVGNVAWSADEIALEEVFGRYGNIKRINQPKDAETGRSTGVAFIEFEDLDAAQKAFRAGNGRGIRVDGRPVRVDFAKNGSHQDGGGQRTTSAAGGRVE